MGLCKRRICAIDGKADPADFLGKTLIESLPEMETQVFSKLLDEVYRTGEPFVGREMKALLNRSEHRVLQ